MNKQSFLVRPVVRGEAHWDALKALGIEFRQVGRRFEVSNPAGVVADASVDEIAAGMVRYAGDGEALCAWATLVLVGSSFLDLADLDHHPAGQVLLNALWDVSFGGELDQGVLDLARTLSQGDVETDRAMGPEV